MELKKLIIVVMFVLGCIGCESKEKQYLNQIQWENCESLMIVAHPDDETIFAGAHLFDQNYLVVCLTNGNHPVRRQEFLNVMEKTGNQGLIFDYPDKTNGKRDSWITVKKAIADDIKAIINQKDWKTIVTHNPDGEYGHIHHQMTSQIVTRLCQKKQLFYFGKYYSQKKLPSNLKTLSKEDIQKKRELTQLYGSQKKVIEHLQHILIYENWMKAKDW